MSSKVELQRTLKEIGYEIGPFASKETLSNVLRLHDLAIDLRGVNVSKLNDLDLRKALTEHGLTVGPVTGHTRSIYQRKLLEALTNEKAEGQEDDTEVSESLSTTPPRATRSSIARGGDSNVTSSPGRSFVSEMQEPRIPLTRVDIDDRNTRNLPSFYPNIASNKPISSATSQETITHSFSPSRSTIKPETRPSAAPSYGLRNPYDFQSDEPVIIRHEHKATPFRTTNVSSVETSSSNTSRYARSSDIPSSTTRYLTDSDKELNEIRSRLAATTYEAKEIKVNKDKPTSKSTNDQELEKKKPVESEKMVVPTKSGGTVLYTGIALVVGVLVFVLYLFFEK